MVIKATISTIRPTGGNHDHRNSAEVTAPNPAGISITPSEIGSSSSSHVATLTCVVFWFLLR
ncbi:hypothetical protein Taro_048727 [Colocasia esculenta]|uniref:Uncharacterized protein n=1 Tax=Colocasia esculenta TaxID=4460 RepID=A0A843X8W0_COLES|nr:hypothetical protein [Colocasia esculenta]